MHCGFSVETHVNVSVCGQLLMLLKSRGLHHVYETDANGWCVNQKLSKG